MPHGLQVVVWSRAALAAVGKAEGFLMNLFDEGPFGLWVEAYVGDSGEKSLQHQPVSLVGDGIGLLEGDP